MFITKRGHIAQAGFSGCTRWNRSWVQAVHTGSRKGRKEDWAEVRVTLWCRPRKALANPAGSSGVSLAHESEPLVIWNAWAFKPPPSSLTKCDCPGKEWLWARHLALWSWSRPSKKRQLETLCPPPSSPWRGSGECISVSATDQLREHG